MGVEHTKACHRSHTLHIAARFPRYSPGLFAQPLRDASLRHCMGHTAWNMHFGGMLMLGGS